MKTPGVKLFLVVALLHFTVMGLAISKVKIYSDDVFWVALRWYGRITGSSSTYSFFSPDIQPMATLHFRVYFPDGRQIDTTLQDISNNEVTARLQNILRTIPKTFKNRLAVRSVIASLTTAVFKYYPEAEKIEVTSVLYVQPTMTEYLAGSRPDYKKTYSATYMKKPDAT